jgi:hypothetical protein
VFFSQEQIAQSITRLEELNPFLGTAFLALKEAGLPVGTTSKINFTPTLEAFLQKYYRPLSDHDGFYIPFASSQPKKRWVSNHYARNLQNSTKEHFSDVLIHPQGKQEWGWTKDYVQILLQKHLSNQQIPTFDLSVWLFRTKDWNNHTTVTDVLETFFSEFRIQPEERALFATNPRPGKFLQEHVVDTQSLLMLIGIPETKSRRESSYEMIPLFSSLSTLAEYGAKLQQLKLTEVGPAEHIELDLAPRLNLITGDNALGKTFLLECAWWALTGTWASKYPAYPLAQAKNPGIAFQIGKEYRSDRIQKVPYNWRAQKWAEQKNRSILPGLSIFCQADGSFAVWDPAKLENPHQPDPETDAFIRISPSEVWDGVRIQRGNKLIVRCRGLIEDLLTWQTSSDQSRFNAFCVALKGLSPNTEYPLIPGKPERLPTDEKDVRDVPTLEFPYGSVPIVLCSAGIKRIVALAYLLVWAWNEHVINSELIREEPQRSIVLLIDEMEAHLHPFWQRVIVPAIMKVVQALSEEVGTQIIIATHSPLVLASVEPLFDEDIDTLFHLDLDLGKGSVQLNQVPFVKRGRIDQWLISDIFGLEQPRSLSAEQLIDVANKLQLDENAPKERVQEVHNQLVKVLAPDDEFWPLWTYFAQTRGAQI